MRKCFSLALMLSLIALGGTLEAQVINDPNVPDTLWVDSSIAFVSGVGVVPVNFVNDEELTLVEATLMHSSDHIRIDSFSFVGGRMASDDFTHNVVIPADSTRIWVVSYTTNVIPPGRGLLGHLYFSYSQTVTPQVAPIDTTSWMEGPILSSNQFVPVGSQGFAPQFRPGYLDIQESPATFDSVWVEDTEGAPGDQVAVNVYAYNELDLAEIALALDYGSELLIFDSVVFVGTRSETATSKTPTSYAYLHKLYVSIKFGQATPLKPDYGPIAVLHFTIALNAPEGIILIDSTTVGPSAKTRFTLTEANGSLPIWPLFYAGSVEVKISTDVEDITDLASLPTEYSLSQNYPNPFNPSTNIEFSLPQAGHVKLEVFNILGRSVRRLIDRDLPAGEHRLVFDSRSDRGTSLATGVYFYRLSTESYQTTKKMLLMK